MTIHRYSYTVCVYSFRCESNSSAIHKWNSAVVLALQVWVSDTHCCTKVHFCSRTRFWAEYCLSRDYQESISWAKTPSILTIFHLKGPLRLLWSKHPVCAPYGMGTGRMIWPYTSLFQAPVRRCSQGIFCVLPLWECQKASPVYFPNKLFSFLDNHCLVTFADYSHLANQTVTISVWC